jgi:hypothetical protein
VPLRLVSAGSATSPARIDVVPPLTASTLRGLPDGPLIVQTAVPLTDGEHALLGAWFAGRPGTTLRVYTDVGPTLDFLRHYPALDAFEVSTRDRDVDLAGLAYLPATLERLALDLPLPRRAELGVLERFAGLRALRLRGVRRLPAALTTLTALRTLRLNGVTADLAPLVALPRLADLTLALGGSTDLTPLPGLAALRHFAAMLVRGLSDVTPLGAVRPLETLHLESLKQVVALPDLSGWTALTTVVLQQMRGLRDLAPLRTAPALRELHLVEMQHLQPADVAVLAGHPTIAEIRVGLGSDRKNLAVRDALRIPGWYGDHPWPPST